MRKAIQHVVIFKLNEEFQQGQLEAAVRQTALMVEKIPGIISASFAPNAPPDLYDTYRPHTGGFTHTLLVTFTNDPMALKNYDSHPVHLELGKLVIPFMKEAICTDSLIDTYPDDGAEHKVVPPMEKKTEG